MRLSNIKTLKILSDLSNPEMQNKNITPASTITTESFLDEKGGITVSSEIQIGCYIEDSEDEVARIIVKTHFLYDGEEGEVEAMSDDDVSEFAPDCMPEIYPHIYNKISGLFHLHGIPGVPIPLSVDGIALTENEE